MSDTNKTGRLYIDGAWREAANGATFEVRNPFDESLVGTAADATGRDVADAVGAARTAFDTTTWPTDVDFRKHCLRQLEEGLGKVKAELAGMATREAGIPANQANLIDSVIEEVAWTAGLMDRFGWEVTLPAAEMLGMSSSRVVRQEPRGVVGAITPWNAPTGMNVGKTAPALAAGNTVVLKPAPDTPLSAVLLAEVIAETDIPPGVFNLITSNDNAVGGDALTGDPRVNMFHFTGSTAVGQRIASRAAVGFRKVVLELGGKSANIILDDADLDTAIPYSVGMCMYNSGQGCLLPTRILVPGNLYDEVLQRVVAVAEAMPWGDPRAEQTLVGPIIRRGQVERMAGLVDRAREAGATIATGGTSGHPDFEKGHWYRPTVVTDVDETAEIAQTEVFGPVLTVLRYDGRDEEAVRIANATRYGLGGFVQSTDAGRAREIANALRSGGVAIGPSFWVAPDTPFGGYGASGIGRERGVEGFLEFLQAKAISTPATTNA
ncbi:aldehyde dehydrogenase family protein [Amycolatopsis sp. GM8]|uniref:aldehyde dehydrogenase family protein n=1 Tax=Amycolatopsis sp. GM8 TaxID=2896530 RepID=UPI001F217F29|nr:aldehyde dehydrogenase family protein [Amycolatopsis sp. GM8]